MQLRQIPSCPQKADLEKLEHNFTPLALVYPKQNNNDQLDAQLYKYDCQIETYRDLVGLVSISDP